MEDMPDPKTPLDLCTQIVHRALFMDTNSHETIPWDIVGSAWGFICVAVDQFEGRGLDEVT